MGKIEASRRNRNRDGLYIQIFEIINIILIMIPFVYVWTNHFGQKIRIPFFRVGNYAMYFLFVVVYTYLSNIYSSFKLHINRISETIYSLGLSLILTNSVIYIVIVLLSAKLPNIVPLLLSTLVQMILGIIWAYFATKAFHSLVKPLSTVAVWDIRKGVDELVEKYNMQNRFNVIDSIYVGDCIKDIEGSLKKCEAVFMVGLHSHERNQIIKYCVDNYIDSYVIPRVGDVIMSGANKMHLFHLPTLRIERYNPSLAYLFFKRLFDIVLSLIAIVILLPVFIIVGLLIKLDGGDIIYKQRRLTKDGKEFDLYKFRSMKMNAEEDGVARLSTGENDERVTKVGKFIRKFRIDELPQLFNILMGDISIVGPRPERPEIAKQYEEELPEFSLRLQAKAGLTGYAQIYGKYNTTPYDKLLMDLMYISQPSLAEDFKLILATIKILFIPESTEGVEEGKSNAMD